MHRLHSWRAMRWLAVAPWLRASAGARRHVDPALPRLLERLWPDRWLVLAALACLVVIALTDPALVWLVRQVTDFGVAGGTGLAWYWAPTALAALFLVKGAAAFMAGYLMIRVSSGVLLGLQQEVYEAALWARADQREPAHVGKSVNAMVLEGRQSVELIERVAIKFFRSLFSVLALLGYLCCLQPWLGLLALAFAVPFYVAVRVTGRLYRQAADRYIAGNNELIRTGDETLGRLPLIRQYGSGQQELACFSGRADAVAAQAKRMNSIAGAMVPLTQSILSVLLMLLFALRPVLGDALSTGEFVAFVANVMLMLVPLRDLAEVNGAMLRGLAGSLAIFGAIDTVAERRTGRTLQGRAAGRIEFEGVAFRYPGSAVPTLDGLDLRIEAGETIALVGACGAGKSTLLGLIPEFHSVLQGRILLDGCAIADLSLASLRRQIAMVSQETALLDDTIAANVAYGDAAPDRQRMLAALEAAQLREYVAGLPDGLDAPIGENGARLSGGQRQLLMLARAFYRDAPILLLDEPTSALDAGAERLIHEALRRLKNGRTTIIASHSAATLSLADRVVVLECGKASPQAQAAAPCAPVAMAERASPSIALCI